MLHEVYPFSNKGHNKKLKNSFCVYNWLRSFAIRDRFLLEHLKSMSRYIEFVALRWSWPPKNIWLGLKVKQWRTFKCKGYYYFLIIEYGYTMYVIYILRLDNSPSIIVVQLFWKSVLLIFLKSYKQPWSVTTKNCF